MAKHVVSWLAILSLPCCLSGCPSKESLAFAVVADGVINDASNKSLRFDLLKFGLGQFCQEMTTRGAPLKTGDDMPIAGRFFSTSCQHQILDDENRKSLVVQYSGQGYGWTNLSGRVGFSSSGLVEYAPDFQVEGDAMYIYFRPRNVDASSFETLMVESGTAQSGMALAEVDPNQVGTSLVQGQLKRGFTVIRYSERGETDFSLGYVPVGSKPEKPYVVESSNRVSLTNDRTEVHTGQQDYIGSFEVTDDDQALFFTAKLDGTEAIDVALVPRSGGSEMLKQYVTSPGAATLAMPPLLQETIALGQTWQRGIKLTRGTYMLVIDHSGRLGQSAPPTHPADSPAHLSYLVQRGPAD